MKKKQHFAIELDGVLFEPLKKKSERLFGEPIPGARSWVIRMLKNGHQITIFTTRERVGFIQLALVNRGFPPVPVINMKMDCFTCIIDSKMIGFSPDLFDPIHDVEFEDFSPWHTKSVKALGT